jgi:hypothetical protein
LILDIHYSYRALFWNYKPSNQTKFNLTKIQNQFKKKIPGKSNENFQYFSSDFPGKKPIFKHHNICFSIYFSTLCKQEISISLSKDDKEKKEEKTFQFVLFSGKLLITEKMLKNCRKSFIFK